MSKRTRWEGSDDEVDGETSSRKRHGSAASSSKSSPALASSANSSSSRIGTLLFTRRNYTKESLNGNVEPKSPNFLQSCRNVELYERLNRIEEGSYGVVSRAREKATGQIVALKKLKMGKEKNGFPITALREIHTLMLCRHPNIVHVREIVMGDSLSSIYIVMDFMEHDLKTLLETMRSPFQQSEIKTITMQLLSAVDHMHSNWIMHRDLKTSNLLMNNRGQIKVADFGLARKYGDPIGPMTQLVVTLWYRAPELLLGEKRYTPAVDIWSVGCILGELLNKEPMMDGRGEIDQIDKMFYLLGMPNKDTWPGLIRLPNYKSINWQKPYRGTQLMGRFSQLSSAGLDLLSRLLEYNPSKRISASEALEHPFFRESPFPKDPEMFPTFPSIGAGERRVRSPSAPHATHGQADDTTTSSIFAQPATESTFQLRY